jgi:ligand-binding sensor domain-containing protein
MASNISGHACFDSSGYMWISTNEGVISYDGIRITQYLKETHPALPRNETGYLFCDSRNRIWICTNSGLALLDEQRRIQPVEIHDSLKNRNIDYCFEVKDVGMIAIASRKSYLLSVNNTEWKELTWFDETIRKDRGVESFQRVGDHQYSFVSGNRVLLVDFKSKQKLVDISIRNIMAVCRLNNSELIAITDSAWGMFRIDIASNSIGRNYPAPLDQYGKPIIAAASFVTLGADGNAYISTRSAGIVCFDPLTEKFRSYRHDPLDDHSLSSNFLRWIYAHKDGYLMITSSRGVNFTNVLYTMFRQLKTFRDKEGNIYDGHVIGITEDKKKRIWFNTFYGLLQWDMSSNFVTPVSKIIGDNLSGRGYFNLGRPADDAAGNMWVSENGDGLCIYTVDGKLIRKLKAPVELPSERIRLVTRLDDGNMFVGAEDGMYTVNTRTYKADAFSSHPALKDLVNKRIIDMMPDGKKFWIAVSPGGGAYCYDPETKNLEIFNTKSGLSSERVYCLAKDSSGNVYVGTYDGLNIITNGKIRQINKNNGLRHPRVENIVTDKKGMVWITNFSSLIRYNPSNNSFEYFDERNGVNNSGFLVGSNCITSEGNILFGSTDGILVVDPGTPLSTSAKLRISIQRVYSDNAFERVADDKTIRLSHKNARLNFYYRIPDLVSSNRYLYRYRLEGLDTGWSSPTLDQQVSYSLRPGNYSFRVQVSYNKSTWFETGHGVSIYVSPAYWQTWWFWVLVILLAGSLVFWLVRRRIRSIKAKADLQQQLAELEGKALRAQMNPHFIFNCLNAIQKLNVVKDFDASYHYLSRFSKLLRLVLDNSDKNMITLSQELEMNNLYLELESLRFKNSFEYVVEMYGIKDPEEILIPSLLLQPFIENAIWHGLMNKEGDKKLFICFHANDEELSCTIQDNGIGRERSSAIKGQKIGSHYFESKGTKLSEHRIRLLNRMTGGLTKVEYEDLKDEAGDATGTRVTIKIPLIKTEWHDTRTID